MKLENEWELGGGGRLQPLFLKMSGTNKVFTCICISIVN